MQYLTTPVHPSQGLNRPHSPLVRRVQGLALLGERVLRWRVLPPEKVPACAAALRQLEGFLGVVSHRTLGRDRASRSDRQALEALEAHARAWVVEGLLRAEQIPGIHAFDLEKRLREGFPSEGLWAGFPLDLALPEGPLKVGGRPEVFDRLLLAWMGRVAMDPRTSGRLRISVSEGAFENGNPAAILTLDSPGGPWDCEVLEEAAEPGLFETCAEARSLNDLLAGLRGTGWLACLPSGGNRWVLRLPLAPQFHP